MNNDLYIKRVLLLCQDDLETLPYHRVYPLIDFLAPRVERLDVLYYDRCFDKNVSGIIAKLCEGIKDFFTKPKVKVKTVGNITYYGIRRLPLDGILSTLLQDPWIYYQFRSYNPASYDLCISEAPGPAQIAMKMEDKGYTKKFIYDDTDYFPGFAKGFRAFAIKMQEIVGVHHADKVICVSQTLVELRKRQKIKAPVYIPNGVDLLKYHKMIPHFSTNELRMIYAGSLESWAGIDILIRAIAKLKTRLPECTLTVIGDGPVRKDLETLRDRLGLTEKIQFLGRKHPDELISYFEASDIGVSLPQPSLLWDYACPLKLFQYMACGLPVLATKTGEQELLMEKYHPGIAVEYDEDHIARGILQLSEKRGQWPQYSQNGKKYAPIYDWNRLLQMYWDVIEGLLNANRN